MQEISGRLTRLGSGTVAMTNVGKSFVSYDSIEIGDTVLQKVRTARSLSDYVSDGLGHDTTLYMNGKFLVGVKLPNGKVYYWKRSPLAPMLMLLAFVPLAAGLAAAMKGLLVPILIAGGLYYMVARSELQHVFSCQPKLAAQGGIPLKS